mmetsp:Transcript_10820/g.29704  ORF Transcript_10820/g.29704 Transcript_10820/m.29704 type:complete len:231 (+) Transcript_10820:765-1457(+)
MPMSCPCMPVNCHRVPRDIRRRLLGCRCYCVHHTWHLLRGECVKACQPGWGMVDGARSRGASSFLKLIRIWHLSSHALRQELHVVRSSVSLCLRRHIIYLLRTACCFWRQEHALLRHPSIRIRPVASLRRHSRLQQPQPSAAPPLGTACAAAGAAAIVAVAAAAPPQAAVLATPVCVLTLAEAAPAAGMCEILLTRASHTHTCLHVGCGCITLDGLASSSGLVLTSRQCS